MQHDEDEPRSPQAPRQDPEPGETDESNPTLEGEETTKAEECQGDGSAESPAATILIEERARFVGWLKRGGVRSEADAEDIVADAILRAIKYARPANDVAPRAAAWRHLRLARLEHWRGVGGRSEVIELETDHPPEPPDTRMATPAELVALRQFAERVVELARERLVGRTSVLVALEARVGPLFGRPGMTRQELADRLGVAINRAYKLSAEVERVLADASAELLGAA